MPSPWSEGALFRLSLVVVGGVLSSASDYLPLASAVADRYAVHVMERRGPPGSGAQRPDHGIDSEAREIDVLARMGGEEFVALLPGADLDEAGGFAERIRARLASSAGDHAPRVTASAGVASAVAPARVEELLKAADMALYAAKAQGRNRTAAVPAAGAPG